MSLKARLEPLHPLCIEEVLQGQPLHGVPWGCTSAELLALPPLLRSSPSSLSGSRFGSRPSG